MSKGDKLMSSAEVPAEQRGQRRFIGIDGALAAILTSDLRSYTSLGDIVDISRSGLALRYVGKKGQELNNSALLDVFAYKGTRIYLEKLPCRIVYDHPLETDVPSLKTRRCGLQFGELTPSQRSQLDYFIQANTNGEATRAMDA
jgi:c-di-GMP-binding flagellar brake protein YcgR